MSHHVERLVPEGMHAPAGAYSHVVRARGEILWLAGQVAIDEQGQVVGAGDVVAQFEQVIRNIGHVLESAGAGWGDLVRALVLCVGKENVARLREARTRKWAELYPDGSYPASTFVVVDGLASDDFLVEIEATAVLP